MNPFRSKIGEPVRLGCAVYRSGLLWAVCLIFLSVSTPLNAQDLNRPCGPDSMTGPLRLLVPQGVSGADFRAACVRHDACYDEFGSLKANCDVQFKREMICACRNSRHPLLCRWVATVMHRVTTRRGQSAFDSAQRIAAAKLLAAQ